MQLESSELNRAQSLLRNYEKSISELRGLSYLSEAFGVLSDFMESTESTHLNERARNMFYTYKNSIRKKIKYILSNQGVSSFEELDYWDKVIQEVIDFDLDNDQEIILLQKNIVKHKERLKVKPLPTNKELEAFLRKLSGSERKIVMEILDIRNTSRNH
jgi:hypothetical protein